MQKTGLRVPMFAPLHRISLSMLSHRARKTVYGRVVLTTAASRIRRTVSVRTARCTDVIGNAKLLQIMVQVGKWRAGMRSSVVLLWKWRIMR